MRQQNPDLIRIGELALKLQVSVDTIRRWTKQGKIPVYQTPGGIRRYHLTEVKKALRTYAERMPAKNETV